MSEPLYGYSVKDITQLEVEIEEHKRKRNTFIVIGSIIAGIAIIAAIVMGVFLINNVIKNGVPQNREAKLMELVYDLILSILGLIGSGGEAIAVAGGVTNHVKAKRKSNIVRYLKKIKEENQIETEQY